MEPSREARACQKVEECSHCQTMARQQGSRGRGSGSNTLISCYFPLAGPTQNPENKEAQEMMQSTEVGLSVQRAQ